MLAEINNEEAGNNNFEYVALPINNVDDAVSYKIKKGSVVSIYYTAKLEDVKNILNDINKLGEVYSKDKEDIDVTVKLFENIEIAGAFDSIGNEEKVFTNILILANKEDVLKLVNLKNNGTFSLGLIE
ncbi:MAG: hypothetical protein IKV94_03695 [Clostridia bacterium]|nr:hypothetical protein [Clostridia bacterium]